MPANLIPADDVREWMEFYGTATERLSASLAEAEAELAKGRVGLALHCLKSARVTASLLTEGVAKARAELGATAPVSSLPTPDSSSR